MKRLAPFLLALIPAYAGAQLDPKLEQCEAQIIQGLDEVEVIAAQLTGALHERDDVLADFRSLSEDYAALDAAHGDLEADLGEAQGQLADCVSLRQDLEAQVAELLTALSQEEEATIMALSELAASQAHVQELEEQILVLQGEQAALQTALDDATAVAEAYTADLAERDALNASLQFTIHQIQLLGTEKDVALIEAEVEIARMRLALEEAERVIATLSTSGSED